jgi:hypothetical protein
MRATRNRERDVFGKRPFWLKNCTKKKANLNNNYVRSGVNTSKNIGNIKETRREVGVRYAEKCEVQLR